MDDNFVHAAKPFRNAVEGDVHEQCRKEFDRLTEKQYQTEEAVEKMKQELMQNIFFVWKRNSKRYNVGSKNKPFYLRLIYQAV